MLAFKNLLLSSLYVFSNSLTRFVDLGGFPLQRLMRAHVVEQILLQFVWGGERGAVDQSSFIRQNRSTFPLEGRVYDDPNSSNIRSNGCVSLVRGAANSDRPLRPQTLVALVEQ